MQNIVLQGSSLSTILCSLYLADLERRYLLPLLPCLQRPQSPANGCRSLSCSNAAGENVLLQLSKAKRLPSPSLLGDSETIHHVSHHRVGICPVPQLLHLPLDVHAVMYNLLRQLPVGTPNSVDIKDSGDFPVDLQSDIQLLALYFENTTAPAT